MSVNPIESVKNATLFQWTTSILSIIVICTVCYIYVSGRTVPDALLLITMSIISFYLGVQVTPLNSRSDKG